MRVESYFADIRNTIEQSLIVRLSNVSYEKRGTHEGIIRGRVQFLDDTVLEWREYVDVEINVDRLMYSYQYMDASTLLPSVKRRDSNEIGKIYG